MKNINKLLIGGVLLTLGFAAHAESAADYLLNVTRSEGDMTCQFSKTNSGTADCTNHVVSQASLPITMKLEGSHYVGADKVTEVSNKLVLALVADQNRALKDIVLLQGVSNADSFDGSVSVTGSAGQLMAVNIDPIHVQVVDSQTIEVDMSYVAYKRAKSTGGLTPDDQKALTNAIAARVQPIAQAVMK